MILSHVSVGVGDVAAAVKFYDAVLATLSITRSHYEENVTASYGEALEFWVGTPCEGRPTAGNGVHVAFEAPDRKAVDEFYREALELGGRCAGKPGLRPEYSDSYYAAFVFDLDGNKIEAVAT
ncbi:VOC family protein [Microbulbifer yueqingensis]|uniref:Catechol 2,3-dioxygenase n=1 Tax=Microbulbifer yueqingensis TaxID=658219 RepID=A0A1G8VZ87_9GAMM|nr:VOC family protein [Microbulbifer yueqingensis]SDJ71411.1 Catechol 2,3-dioxygenase [Microbulbifer yueqingensis]